MKQIEVPKGVARQIEREFKSTYLTVANALKLITQTEKAKAIRKRAFELGGKLVDVEQVKVEDNGKE